MGFKVPSIHIFPLLLNVRFVIVGPEVIAMQETVTDWLIDCYDSVENETGNVSSF